MKGLNLAREMGGIYFHPEDLESIIDNPVRQDCVTSTLVFKSGKEVIVLGEAHCLLRQLGLTEEK